jgi:hypothetical protein
MLIKTLAYKFASGYANWVEIPIQNQSANLISENSKRREGKLTTTEITAYVPHSSQTKHEAFNQLTAAGGLFVAITPGNDKYFLGTDSQKAVFTFENIEGGKAGSRGGYNIKILSKTASPLNFKSFQSALDSSIIAPITIDPVNES